MSESTVTSRNIYLLSYASEIYGVESFFIPSSRTTCLVNSITFPRSYDLVLRFARKSFDAPRSARFRIRENASIYRKSRKRESR